MELHKLKEGVCLLGKDHLAQGLNMSSVLGPSGPPASELSLGWSGMPEPFNPPALMLPLWVRAGCPHKQRRTLLCPRASQVIRDQVPSVPGLHFPSARSGEEEASLMWVLSLQMFSKNFTFCFSLRRLLAQLHQPIKHRASVQRRCKGF